MNYCVCGATVYMKRHKVRAIVAGAILGVLPPIGAHAVVEIVPAPVAGSPEGDALRMALVGPDVAREAVRSHYETFAYRGLWIGKDGDDTRAVELIGALSKADLNGLSVARYRVDALDAALKTARRGDPAAIARAELALTRAFLTYADDLHGGLLSPGSVDRDLHLDPPVLDERGLLDRLARGGTVEAVLASVEPTVAEYAGLRALLAEYRGMSPGAWGALAGEGPSIRPGESGPRVASIRARLTTMGDHEPPATAPETAGAGAAPEAAGAGTAPEAGGAAGKPAADAAKVYDDALQDSVRDFQRRHGLNDDGVIGARTVRAMNASVEDRIGQILVNMERLRWTNRPKEAKHIDVNQADFTVRLVDGDAVLFEERVVVGSRRHRTPEFSDEMAYLVFNPTWHVPRSIAREEILPALQQDPEYLSKRNMRLISRDGYPTPDPAMTDWSLYSGSDFPFSVKQNPGGGNALGRVKFMFPNAFSIYLHDTPSKRLFAKDARAFSHGCIRVQDPMRLAEVLLSAQEGDPAAKIQRILASGRETTVHLETPVPVHLEYRTAWIDDAGRVQFRDDVYGRDGRILSALQAAGVGAGG